MCRYPIIRWGADIPVLRLGADIPVLKLGAYTLRAVRIVCGSTSKETNGTGYRPYSAGVYRLRLKLGLWTRALPSNPRPCPAPSCTPCSSKYSPSTGWRCPGSSQAAAFGNLLKAQDLVREACQLALGSPGDGQRLQEPVAIEVDDLLFIMFIASI